MGKVVNELSNVPSSSGSATSNITMDKDHDNISYTGQQIAAVLALMVGIWEVLLGLLQMGALLNVFLSDMLISGFTTGVAVHVLTSQIKYLFGIPVTAYSGPLKLIYIYIDVFRKIFDANPGEMLISAFCISLLVFNNEMKPKVKKYTNIPIPIELMVVILGTAASYYGQLHEVYGIRIVGHISTGLPAPSSPPVELLPRVALDAFIIGIVGYTSTFSVAKIFAKRRGYAVDATQELYAQVTA
ncbi:hypothetical protein SK128_006615 [Halocaridina rubra]|uniref:SLC26A/SulP transporter domain-containing protein n=1 Tax=Halocaridina rubra TaxID=373956 RepID=A0AAN8WZ38_HALRR